MKRSKKRTPIRDVFGALLFGIGTAVDLSLDGRAGERANRRRGEASRFERVVATSADALRAAGLSLMASGSLARGRRPVSGGLVYDSGLPPLNLFKQPWGVVGLQLPVKRTLAQYRQDACMTREQQRLVAEGLIDPRSIAAQME